MQTEIVPLKESLDLPKHILAMRELSMEDFIQKYSSGTLRDSVEYDTGFINIYRHERICWEFGSGFECIPATNILFNTVIAEWDCSEYREALYFFKRMKVRRVFQEDQYEFKYIHITERDGKVREVAGIVVKQTTCTWIPKGHLIVAIVSVYDKAKETWSHVENPS